MKRYFRFVIYNKGGVDLYSSWYDMEEIDVAKTLRFVEYTKNISDNFIIEYKECEE